MTHWWMAKGAHARQLQPPRLPHSPSLMEKRLSVVILVNQVGLARCHHQCRRRGCYGEDGDDGDGMRVGRQAQLWRQDLESLCSEAVGQKAATRDEKQVGVTPLLLESVVVIHHGGRKTTFPGVRLMLLEETVVVWRLRMAAAVSYRARGRDVGRGKGDGWVAQECPDWHLVTVCMGKVSVESGLLLLACNTNLSII